MFGLKKRHTRDPKRVNDVLGFVNLGFKDYLAARSLLNTDLAALALPGSIFASTSVEKYFKAIVAFSGNRSSTHLSKALINSIRNYDLGLYNKLNPSFLEFLQRCYQLRYFDSIQPGFTLSIVSRQVLAELDFTVSEMQKRFTFEQDSQPILTPYDAYLRDKNPLLFENNYILQGLDKSAFIEREVSIYVMRLDESRGLIEVLYTTKGRNDGNFLAPGLIPDRPPGPDDSINTPA